jgi:hypothetical protein
MQWCQSSKPCEESVCIYLDIYGKNAMMKSSKPCEESVWIYLDIYGKHEMMQKQQNMCRSGLYIFGHLW